MFSTIAVKKKLHRVTIIPVIFITTPVGFPFALALRFIFFFATFSETRRK